MNAERRKKISEILSTLEQCAADLDELRESEREAYDNLPESFQNGERGEAMQAAISSLDDAHGYVDSAVSSLGEIE